MFLDLYAASAFALEKCIWGLTSTLVLNNLAAKRRTKQE